MNTSHGPNPSGTGGRRSVPPRRWLIVPGLAALGLIASAAYVVAGAAVTPRAYVATAAVDVNSGAIASGQGIVVIPGRVPGVRGQAQAARSMGVAAIAGRMMHSGLSPRALIKNVIVVAPPNSGALNIACAGSSAGRAATCADDFAKAYLQSSGRSAAELADMQVSTLRRAVTSLSRARATLLAKAATLPLNSPGRAADEARLTWDHRALHIYARQIRAETGELTHPSSGSIVALATAAEKSAGPSKLPVLLSGPVAGLLLGVIAALLLRRRDKRIHDSRAA